MVTMSGTEGGGGAGLALEALAPIGIGCQIGRQDLDGDVAVQPRVARAIDLAHAAGTERGEDFVRAETRPDGQGHE
jgi:hypothetical protein